MEKEFIVSRFEKKEQIMECLSCSEEMAEFILEYHSKNYILSLLIDLDDEMEKVKKDLLSERLEEDRDKKVITLADYNFLRA